MENGNSHINNKTNNFFLSKWVVFSGINIRLEIFIDHLNRLSAQYLFLNLRVKLAHPLLICIHLSIYSTKLFILSIQCRAYILIDRLQLFHAAK